jgi:putative tryptophan/tyrosine transport system substrate-binding protein
MGDRENMKRRQFIAAIAASAAWSFPALAQRSKVPVIGYLAIRSPLPIDDTFFQELRKFGWIEGETIVIERRFAGGSEEQLKKFAGELVNLKVDLIVAIASGATHASKAVTKSIPIVFVNAGDPVGQGFVQSLAHPGGNITGSSFDATPDITAKQVQLLVRVIPGAKRLAAFWNPRSPFLATYLEVARSAASALQMDFESLEMQSPENWDSMFSAMVADHVDGVVVLSDSFAVFHRARITELAAKYRLPSIYGHSQYTEAGGLMSYGSSFSDAFQRAPGYVDRVLKGELTTDLPVQQPTKFELILNLKTAKAIGIAIPSDMIAVADQVIE